MMDGKILMTSYIIRRHKNSQKSDLYGCFNISFCKVGKTNLFKIQNSRERLQIKCVIHEIVHILLNKDSEGVLIKTTHSL